MINNGKNKNLLLVHAIKETLLRFNSHQQELIQLRKENKSKRFVTQGEDFIAKSNKNNTPQAKAEEEKLENVKESSLGGA